MHPYRWDPRIEDRLRSAALAVAELRRHPLPPAAVQSLQRWFRIHHVYHSNAIEGNRLTLPETRVVVEDGITVAGKSLKEHAEALNLAHALDFVEELASAEEPLQERLVRELHDIVLRGIEPRSAGRYRQIPVRITGTDYRPPEPLVVPERMEQLGRWLEGSETENPVVRATIAHTWLVAIHPFVDGNGRTSRLLANLVLLRAGYPVIVLRVERRAEYYAALDTSHSGDLTPMLKLMLDTLEESLTEYQRSVEDLERMDAHLREGGEEPT
jgi:Fic family protein